MTIKRSRINQTIYPVRVVGYVLAIISILLHQFYAWDKISVTTWIFVGIFLSYPHIAFLVSGQAKDHRKAEYWILSLDLFWIAWIGYLLDFNLMSALPFLIANSATSYSVGGFRVFARSWLLWLIGNAIIIALMPLNPRIMSVENLGALIPSVLYMFAATHYIAMVSYHKGISILRVKKQLQEQNLELKEQKEELLVMNEEIRQQNEEIISQRDHIEEQNKALDEKNQIIEKTNQDITSSINYAKRIQQAILPEMDTIRKYFQDCFVFYRPRDIVSGDFYWLAHKNYKIIVAVVDCTGHGIPGALMSMIGNELLNDIVKSRNITEPDKILNALRRGIIHTLRQEESNNQDGMDVAICCIDNYPDSYREHLGEPKLEYAGAGIPLVYVQNEQLYEIRPDRIIIGGMKMYENQQSFQKHSILLNTPTSIYLFSDGYQDQFGGADRKKFSSKRFKQILFKYSSLQMNEQKYYLEQAIDEWMAETEEKQLDDMTIIGLQIA